MAPHNVPEQPVEEFGPLVTPPEPGVVPAEVAVVATGCGVVATGCGVVATGCGVVATGAEVADPVSGLQSTFAAQSQALMVWLQRVPAWQVYSYGTPCAH